ncbi:MAG: hypothetical protein WCA91_23970 [Candidatus Acidiferrales bacterium]
MSVTCGDCSWSVWTELRTVGIRKNPFLTLRFVIEEPKAFADQLFSGRLYCTDRSLWKLNWFLRDFSYDPELLIRDQVDDKALVNLRGVVRTSPIAINGRSYQNLESFAPAGEWEELSCAMVGNMPQQDKSDDF